MLLGRVGLRPRGGFRVVAGTGIVGDRRRDLVKGLDGLRRGFRACHAALHHVTDGLLRAGEARETKQRSQNHSAHECPLTQLQARYARSLHIDKARYYPQKEVAGNQAAQRHSAALRWEPIKAHRGDGLRLSYGAYGRRRHPLRSGLVPNAEGP